MIIPQSVIDLMWEYDPMVLAVSTELPDAVMERVMARGPWNDMRWLLDTAGRDKLRDFLERRGIRTLPPRELRFWCWITGFPESQTADWVKLARIREAAWRR